VYGTNTKLPFSEEDRTDHPANLYGATKKANEVMAYSYHHLFGLKLIGLRFFTVYGPWGRPDMAYFLFADKIVKGEKIELFGEGKLRRDFTYIDDIVDGVIAALAAPQPFALYNLGNHSTEPVQTLVALLEKELNKKAVISLVECQKGDMVDTWADIHLAQKELGFLPKTPLSEGIREFVSWYKNYYKIKNK
jgi:UDP-glucuronate 4-epimerase